MKSFFCLTVLMILLNSCGNNEGSACQYKLESLLVVDTPNTVIANQNDTLVEVRDKKNGYPTGIYTFDKGKNLRFYGFFVNDSQYLYSESYDVDGNIIEKERNPLLEYSVRKGNGDTVVFNAFLFSLNKKFEDIEVTAENSGTIRPNLLYKANIYSNSKCFQFKLPNVNNINDFRLYTSGIVINTCTQKREAFNDTTLFKGTHF